jgi:hypothetical protein
MILIHASNRAWTCDSRLPSSNFCVVVVVFDFFCFLINRRWIVTAATLTAAIDAAVAKTAVNEDLDDMVGSSFCGYQR